MGIADVTIQKRIKEGNILEFEKTFLGYYEQLCHYSFKFTNDMDASEDIVQEFFYQFWKNRDSLLIRLSLRAYLYHSIRNNSIHYVEKRQKRIDLEQDLKKVEPEIENLETSNKLYLDDLNKQINRILEEMPERTSLIFRLNRFEGRKYKEIAELLAISVKTVEADMGKALKTFHKALDDFREVNTVIKH